MRNRPSESTRSFALWVTAFTFAAASAVVPAHGSTQFGTSGLSRLFARSEQPLREYRAYRRMHAFSEGLKHEAWMEARTELKDGRFTYEIVSERGSDAIRGKVLRAMLDRERDVVNNGDGDRADLTPANYEFTEAGRAIDGTHIVQIKPRRQDVLLVDGRAVLNERGELLRVEGKLSKNPSFWTSLVNIVRRYARVAGVRVPIATETTAKVKFVGNAQLEVLYDYQSVNGRAVAVSDRRPAALVHTAGQ
jgi:hypothetical protein